MISQSPGAGMACGQKILASAHLHWETLLQICFTFTTGSIALVGAARRASLGGLRTKAQGLHGISTVELWACRVWISVDVANMESGSPYAL